MRLIAQTNKAGRRWNATFDVRRQSVQEAVRTNVSEVASAAELIIEASATVQLDAVHASVVKIHTHKNRSRRRCGYKHEARCVLRDDLVTAEKRSRCARRK